MAAIKITKDYFSGNSKTYSANPGGLSDVLRGLAIELAKQAVAVTGVPDFTDNSTGTGAAGVAVVPELALIDASGSAVGSPAAGFATAAGKIDDAFAVLAENMNKARTRLGLPLFTYSGTVAASGTIAACDKTLTAASGTSAVTLVSAKAAIDLARKNVRKLTYGLNEVLTAIGAATIADANKVNYAGLALGTIGDGAASADGTDAASDATVDAAVTAIVNNIATLAAAWNTAMSQASTPTTPLLVVAG